jgi:hypothetical protein
MGQRPTHANSKNPPTQKLKKMKTSLTKMESTVIKKFDSILAAILAAILVSQSLFIALCSRYIDAGGVYEDAQHRYLNF